MAKIWKADPKPITKSDPNGWDECFKDNRNLKEVPNGRNSPQTPIKHNPSTK